MTDARLLLEEAAKKSGLVWVDVPGGDARARAVWHLWQDGAVHVLTGGIEQPLPGIERATEVTVTVRSKDKGNRLVSMRATVSRVEPGSDDWEALVPQLLGKRLNLPDGEDAAQRWARESALWRLTPYGEAVEQPGRYAPGSHATPPPPSPARTRVPLPLTLARLRERLRG